MIYILTGDIRSGKTTSIYLASMKRKDVGGFLTPDEGNTRVIYDINNRCTYPFQVSDSCSKPSISIGRFKFLMSAFDKGDEIIRKQIGSRSINYIVVDEIGKLELKNQGFHPLVKSLISKELDQDLILIVRYFLLDAVVEKYNISGHRVLCDINQVL